MLSELLARDRALTIAGGVMILGLVVSTLLSIGDTRLVTGVNPWLKPMKFYSSVAIFLLTAAWFMGEARPAPLAHTLIRWTFIVALSLEMVGITMQAARGVPSHFNVSTPFDAAVFSAMGMLIVANTVAAGTMMWLMRPDTPDVRAGYLWGIRLGLAIFVVASLIGFQMVANMGHTVPKPDGGPGLPFVNWSTERGDLRIAHFVGLHALQGLPVFGFLLDRATTLEAMPKMLIVSAAAVAWMTVVGVLFVTALRGRPLVAL